MYLIPMPKISVVYSPTFRILSSWEVKKTFLEEAPQLLSTKQKRLHPLKEDPD